MRRPGVPEDLADAGELWDRAVTLALATTAVGDGDEYTFKGRTSVHCWNSGGAYWWRLERFDGDRALLTGQDSDGSHTHLGRTPVDLLDGGPPWLPWERLRADAADRLLGYAYWWQDGAWARAAYPDGLSDDGLGMSVPWAAPGGAGVRKTIERLASLIHPDDDPADEVLRFLGRVRERTVDGAAVGALADALYPPVLREDEEEEDIDAVVDVAAGLTLARDLGVAAHAG
ncbi:hypothetical protein [Streptomyces sp. NPDC050504]|uniref:hypothetical protein n=1 Tax=Streptomyces sp. NPDC050504 TaxID=3365618 RepID=UPI003795592A